MIMLNKKMSLSFIVIVNLTLTASLSEVIYSPYVISDAPDNPSSISKNAIIRLQIFYIEVIELLKENKC